MPHEQVLAGIRAALQTGALTADVVALEARKTTDAVPTTPRATTMAPTRTEEPTTVEPVGSLTVRRLPHLPTDIRPMPSIAAYDALLRRRTSTIQE